MPKHEPTSTLYLRLPPWLHDSIERKADLKGQTMSEYVRKLLMEFHKPPLKTQEPALR